MTNENSRPTTAEVNLAADLAKAVEVLSSFREDMQFYIRRFQKYVENGVGIEDFMPSEFLQWCRERILAHRQLDELDRLYLELIRKGKNHEA